MKTILKNKKDRKHFIDQHVDMHMHTTASDGSYRPGELVRGAHKKGVNVLSITDHDNVDGVQEAYETAQQLAIEFHTGIEMTTDIILPDHYKDGKLTGEPLKTELHILGYDIDTQNEKVLEFCQQTALYRQAYNWKVMSFLLEQYGVGPDDIGREYIKGYLGKPQIARAFQETHTMDTISEIRNKVFANPDFLAIEKERIMADKAVKIIREAGGESVLAHPGRIKHIGERESQDFFKNVELILQQLVEYGLVGLESVYLTHTDAEKKRFLNLTDKYNLIPTRGTDFHS